MSGACRLPLVSTPIPHTRTPRQPWYWEAALVFFVGGFADGPVQAGWAMAMIQGCLYVFGGLHKLNPDFHVALRFVLEGFPAVAAWLDEPRPVAVDVIVRATAALEGLSGAGYLYAGWALTRGWSSKRFARRVGQACLLFSLGMHAFIVVSLCTTHYVTLSTLDGDRRVALQWWNYAVIPWNVWQVAVLAMLFGGSWDLANGETATRPPAWSIWKQWWALLLVFVLVAPPTGWAFNRGTSTTAFEMYTGNVNVPFIYVRRFFFFSLFFFFRTNERQHPMLKTQNTLLALGRRSEATRPMLCRRSLGSTPLRRKTTRTRRWNDRG